MTKKYNLGFLGLSGSGKTCILAALDMQRRAHPAGYTSALLPLDVARPTADNKEMWTNAETEADILHKSSDRLRHVKKQLEKGSVPDATEFTYDFIFDYEFSSGETGNFQARLIDYGGELANPEGYAPERSELREKLTGMDGLFVLAPAPLPGQKDKAISEFLNLLQNTLTGIPFNQPIVLLINKWDRVAPLPEYTGSQEPLTLEQVTSTSTEHRDLYNALRNKVDQENCKAFPISAFGECEQRTTADGKKTEFPKQVNPLASFGLLEGFIWMAQRLALIQSQRNAKQLQSYEQAVASYKNWIPYPSLSLWRLKRQGNEIIRLFPKDSKMAKRARQAQRQSSKIGWTRLTSLLPILVIVPLFGLETQQAYEDNKNYDDVHSLLNNPKAQLDDIKTAEQWLEHYYYTKPFSHPFSWLFVVSNQTAKSELDKLRQQREQILWQAIQEAPSLKKKLQACEVYLKVLPNAKRVGDVNTIIAQVDEGLRDVLEGQWWPQVAQALTETAKFEAARQYQKNLPDGKHKAEIETIIAQIEKNWREKEEQREWELVLKAKSPPAQIKAANAYLKEKPEGKHAADAKNLIAQAKYALQMAEDERVWQPVLKANSPLAKIEAAKAYLKEKPDGQHVADAQVVIENAKEALREAEEKRWWQPVLDAKSPDAKIEAAKAYLDKIPDGIHAANAHVEIANAKKALHEAEEQRWWQPVLDAQSPDAKIEAAKAYLDKIPDGIHAADVQVEIANAKEALREVEEKRWWLPVEQAGSLDIKADKAQAYLDAMPKGKHAADAALFMAQYESQKEWAAFENDYYDWFTNGYFLKAAQHLSQRQPKDDPKLQALKQQFLANVFNSLEAKINPLIEHQKWLEAYKPLDNYGNWPKFFQNEEKRAQIEALRKKVQMAEDRFFYSAFLETRDLERADNYLKSAPLQTMLDRVTAYKDYLIKMQNRIGVVLILDRIEWGNLSDSNNTITVFMDGKKLIEGVGIDAEANSSSEEIGRRFFTHKLSTNVSLDVKIVGINWIADNEDNGQGSKTVKVAKLNGFSLELKPLREMSPISKAVFRLEGIPRKPLLPSWEEK